jgi:2-polyprenyl-3-methyl-5-hydroxy-6-metoxy-1,4-benzoquinol methylase
MSLPFWDPRKVLELPAAYNLFQIVVGADRPRRQFIEDYVVPLKNARVLEVGCGPGTNIQSLPDSIEYVGCDNNDIYIQYARREYGDRAEFYTKSVEELGSLGLKPFDAIIAMAVLHHLNDAEVLTLCDQVIPLLKPGGSFITGDPCFVVNQAPFERFITACDRGEFIRFPDQYEALVKMRFAEVKVEVNPTNSYIPNTSVVLTAIKR